MRKYIPQFVFTIVRTATVFVAALWYRFPSRKLVVIAVTGTKGKTSTCNFITDALSAAGERTAAITTANFRLPSGTITNTTKMTTPGRFALQRFLHDAVAEQCRYVVVEASSIAMSQHRLTGVNVDVGVFTNLSPEHIEMHGSFAKYKEAKLSLFAAVARAKKKPRVPKVAIVNVDDPVAGEFLRYPIDRQYGYSLEGKTSLVGTTITATDVDTSAEGVQFTLHVGTKEVPIQSHVVGFFNVSNLLAAAAVLASQNIAIDQIARALHKVQPVPGRMEFVRTIHPLPFAVIVDYAHEPRSMKSVLVETKSWQPNHVIAVVGSAGGGRDKARRPVLGKLAAKYADFTIVTNEDPYDEDPSEIVAQVTAGVKEAGGVRGQNYLDILDRRQAIKEALLRAQPGDVVILTGKGSETVIMGPRGERTPWSDREVVQELVQELHRS